MKHTKESIYELLKNNDRAVVRAVVVLYQYQTAAEQMTQATKENNGVGFNANDANLLSSFAEQISQGRGLTEKQMVWARKKIMKYSGQLARIANVKAGE